MTLDDCWAIVEAAEKHPRHAVMMENCTSMPSTTKRARMMDVPDVTRGRWRINPTLDLVRG